MIYYKGGSILNASPDPSENHEVSYEEDKNRVKKQFSFENESEDRLMNDNFSKDNSTADDDNVSITPLWQFRVYFIDNLKSKLPTPISLMSNCNGNA